MPKYKPYIKDKKKLYKLEFEDKNKHKLYITINPFCNFESIEILCNQCNEIIELTKKELLELKEV